MERGAILCNAILLLFFANMAVNVVFEPKAYLSHKRQRHDTESQTLNCRNGTILPADSSPSIKIPPEVTINGVSRDVKADQYVKFHCTVVSNMAANVTWLFKGLPLAEQMDHRHSYLDCKMVLHIERVMTKDTGNYTCVVQNEIGRAMASSHLTVIRKQNGPFIQYMGLEGKTESNTAVVGSSLNLTCESQDVQVVNFFKKDGIRVHEGDASHYEMYYISKKELNAKVSKLEIKNVAFEDTGNYTCVAWLKGFITTKTFYLRIVKRSSRPVIESFELQQNMSAYIGSKVNLTCKINNAEAAIFRKAGVTISDCGRFTYFFEKYGADGLVSNLEIIDVAKEDEGVFTCCAFQEAGYLVSKTFTLKTVPKIVTSIPSHSSAVDSKELVQFPQEAQE